MNVVTNKRDVADPNNAKISKHGWLVLAATSLANFLVGLDTSIASVAFPALKSAFPNASTADLSWILTFYSVALAGFLIVAGRIADRIGRLRVFNIGMILFVIGSVGVAVAPSVPIIISMRGMQGFAAALMTPASLGLLVAAWPFSGAPLLWRPGVLFSLWRAVLALY